MTEEEWLTTSNWYRMLPFCGVDSRKFRLALCAACRQVWPLLNKSFKSLVIAAEQFADGLVQQSRLRLVTESALEAFRNRPEGDNLSRDYADNAVRCAGKMPLDRETVVACFQLLRGATFFPEETEAGFLRDIFGNPFRPVTFDPAWRTEAAVGIARGIYDDRAFERLPILADALQEAGCEHPDMLSHCREPGVHVLGCWVVDLVLGK